MANGWHPVTVLTLPPMFQEVLVEMELAREYEGGAVETVRRVCVAYYDPNLGEFRFPGHPLGMPGTVKFWRLMGQPEAG